MATVGGVKVTGHLIRDASGREGIAVPRKYDRSQSRREILSDVARTHAAVVDRKGQKP
ncbi:hypothetical protein [Streptomyces cyaneofuscatus]|uniref:hypothetical protein n=1 Tax=Streptomyces cyaneofuscatus TaxID=66883 RepID=UPI0037B868B4